MDPLPSVTALIPAHDAEAFVELAVRSALRQEYPAELLDVVVVDDGSSDGTAAVVEQIAREAPGRITLIRQENRGLVGAVNRAAEAATGDVLALLDADDVWPPDKIRRQVEVLVARPEVGLVYTDMCVIDADGRVLDASWLAGSHAPRGREVGRLLEENRVTASSIALSGSLREHLFPIPAELPWADWYLAVRTALVADIVYLEEPKTLYRFHGANMSLGTQGAARLRELRGALRVQRWFLRRLTAEQVAPDELEIAWEAFGRMAAEALGVAGSPFAALIDVTDEDRELARHLVGRARTALAAGDLDQALAVGVRAAACDPSADEVRATLLEARARRCAGTDRDPLRDARLAVVCVQLDDVVRDPALLMACADALRGVPDLTVAIDATAADAGEAAGVVQSLADELGLTDDASLDLLLVTGPLDEVGQACLAHGVLAHVGTRRASGTSAPAFTAAELPALRDLVLARRAAA